MPKKVLGILANLDADICSSVIAISEIAIKHKRNRGGEGDMPINGEQAVSLADASDLHLLPLEADHAAMLDRLPLHHRDPFDRLLIAQALADDRVLLTCDTALAAYGGKILIV